MWKESRPQTKEWCPFDERPLAHHKESGMNIPALIYDNRQQIDRYLSLAAEAGEDRATLDRKFGFLRSAIESPFLDEEETLLNLLGTYFKAFMDAKENWDSYLQQAHDTLGRMETESVNPSIPAILVIFRVVLNFFVELKQRNIAAARFLGKAFAEMHPATTWKEP